MRIWLNVLGWAIVTSAAALLALSLWIMAPFRLAFDDVMETADTLVRAPFASSLVIGDSRVQFAEEPEGALFAGFGGATSRHLERLSGVVCPLTGARVTVALGVNDTKADELDLAATRAAFARIADNCERPGLRFAKVWPAEAGVEPAGDDYDPAAIAAINAFLDDLSARTGAELLEVPELDPGFTFDGVHFTEEVSRDYARRLAFDEAGRGD